MSRIDELLDEQDAELDQLTERELQKFLVVYTAARQRLRDRIEALGDKDLEFTRQHLMVMLAQSERGISKMERELKVALDEGVMASRERGLEHLLEMIRANEPEFRDTGSRIERQVLRRFQEDRGLLVHKYSAQRYSASVLEDIQRELSLGAATGETIPQVRDRLAATMDVRASQASTIVRMEMNKAYNEGHRESGEAAHQVLDEPGETDPLMRRAVEFLDMRNNAISRALDGQVAPYDQPWRVSVAAVQAEHVKLQAERRARKLPVRSKVSGIVWPIVDGYYVGMTYPAHFNDRGREVSTRRRWREEGAQAGSSVGGDVHRAGGNVDKFKRGRGKPEEIAAEIATLPARYREHPAFAELVRDADHGGKVTHGSVREAVAAIEAERQGLVPAGLSRAGRGGDFKDGAGREWDVKSPWSDARFDTEDGVRSIIRDLNRGRGVLFDTSYLTQSDYESVWRGVQAQATKDQMGRIVRLNVPW